MSQTNKMLPGFINVPHISLLSYRVMSAARCQVGNEKYLQSSQQRTLLKSDENFCKVWIT